MTPFFGPFVLSFFSLSLIERRTLRCRVCPLSLSEVCFSSSPAAAACGHSPSLVGEAYFLCRGARLLLSVV
jgi:hypothetical protein